MLADMRLADVGQVFNLPRQDAILPHELQASAADSGTGRASGKRSTSLSQRSLV